MTIELMDLIEEKKRKRRRVRENERECEGMGERERERERERASERSGPCDTRIGGPCTYVYIFNC